MKLDEKLMVELKENLNDKIVPMLIGEPGSGMFTWINGLTETMKTEMFCVACDQLIDKNDLTGIRLVLTDDGQGKKEICANTAINKAINYAIANPQETPILIFDSVDRTTPEIRNEVLATINQRKIRETKLPENMRIVVIVHTKNTPWLDEIQRSQFAIKPIDAPKRRQR